MLKTMQVLVRDVDFNRYRREWITVDVPREDTRTMPMVYGHWSVLPSLAALKIPFENWCDRRDEFQRQHPGELHHPNRLSGKQSKLTWTTPPAL